MRYSLTLATVIITTLIVVDLASALNETDGNNDDKLQEATSLSEIKANYLQNETEKGSQEIGEFCYSRNIFKFNENYATVIHELYHTLEHQRDVVEKISRAFNDVKRLEICFHSYMNVTSL